jgi:hypothetical protein
VIHFIVFHREKIHTAFFPYLVEITTDKIFPVLSYFDQIMKSISDNINPETTQIWGIGVPRVHVLHESWELLYFLIYSPLFVLYSPIPAPPSPPLHQRTRKAVLPLITVSAMDKLERSVEAYGRFSGVRDALSG